MPSRLRLVRRLQDLPHHKTTTTEQLTHHVLTLLHPSTDLRLGAVDRHHAGRGDRRVGAAHRPVSGDHAAHGGGLGLLPRRRRPDGGRHRGRPHRAAGQRRGGHAVHVVAVHQRRHLHAHGDVQAGDRLEHGPGAGAEPRGHGPADPARPGDAQRGDGQEEVAQRADDREPLLARRQPRQPVPEQLRHDPVARRTGPPARRGRHHLPGTARLQHAALAGPGENVEAEPHGQRRGRHDPAAERPGGGRADRPAPGAQRPGVPIHHDHAGPIGRRGPVRRHDDQDRCPGADRPRAGRRPHRTGGPRLRPDLHAGRPAVGGALRSTSCPAPMP